jgi:cell division protein ZapD
LASTEVLYNRGGFYGKQINVISILTTYKTISPLHSIGVSMKRVFFDKIDSVGTFPDNRIKMDIIFQDSNGNEYVWTPKWEEVMSIYAESERVEEMNLAGGKWLEDLKEKKQFSDEVLDELAEVIADGRSTDEIADFFEIVGFDADEMRYNLSHDDPLRSKAEGHSNRVYIAKEKLQELNSEDYRYVVQIVQKAADPKQYIGEQEKHQEVVEKLNTALEFENLRVTEDGRVLPIEKDG